MIFVNYDLFKSVRKNDIIINMRMINCYDVLIFKNNIFCNIVRIYEKRFKNIINFFISINNNISFGFFDSIYIGKTKKIFINKWFVNENESIIGVDVSSYQADIDMTKLKNQNIKFIYIKATEGSTSQDIKFLENWKNAKNAGLLSGAYHFFSYDSEGRTQAENFINMMEPNINGRLLPAVDVEYYGDKEQNPPKKEDVVRELKFFLKMVENEYGVKPLIYTRADIYDNYLKGEFSEYKMFDNNLVYTG